jgi:hypothetical protein
LVESSALLRTKARNMKHVFYQFIKWVKGKIWAIIIAYMLGMHNFYKGEDKTPEDITITIELNEVQEDGAPKN